MNDKSANKYGKILCWMRNYNLREFTNSSISVFQWFANICFYSDSTCAINGVISNSNMNFEFKGKIKFIAAT